MSSELTPQIDGGAADSESGTALSPGQKYSGRGSSFKSVRKSEVTRRKILLGASIVFSDKGFDATTILDISEELKMSSASLYYYFKSKESIFFSCIEFELENFLNILTSSVNGSMTPLDKLKNLIEAQIRYEIQNSSRAPLVNFHIYGAHSLKKIIDEPSAERLRILQRQILDTYRQIIRDGIDQQQMRTSNVTLQAFNIIAMIQYIPTWFKGKDDKSIDGIVSEQIHAIMKMLNN